MVIGLEAIAIGLEGIAIRLDHRFYVGGPLLGWRPSLLYRLPCLSVCVSLFGFPVLQTPFHFEKRIGSTVNPLQPDEHQYHFAHSLFWLIEFPY